MNEVIALREALQHLGTEYRQAREQRQQSVVMPTGWDDLEEVCGRMLDIARELESSR